MRDADLERNWYMPFCNEDEIDRILSPESAQDYLLQEKANIVVDNMRYFRVYRNKSIVFKDWSFERSFKIDHYLTFLDHLDIDEKESCSDITFGDMFSNDVNGYAILNEKWGRIICLNEALIFYMKFCNLAILDYKDDIPIYIRKNSLRIATRILLKKEAMDFFMDPRGIIPAKVGSVIQSPIKYELQSIAGHEFCHHLCGHFVDKNVAKKAFLTVEDKQYYQPIYNISQKQEFESDLESLKKPNYKSSLYNNIYSATLIWFLSLELGEAAQDFICPRSPLTPKTHPTAQARFDNISENAVIPKSFNNTKINFIKERVKLLKEFLLDDMSVNFEHYEFYGSVYLDKPNTKWRGKELVDRVDYY